MRKSLFVILLIILSLLLCSCGEQSEMQQMLNAAKQNSVSDVLANAGTTTAKAETTKTTAPVSITVPNGDAKADVDLTTLSSTMVYSEVLNMIQNPSEYSGKKVKMSGAFAMSEGPTRNYYACIIKDATQCCAQGIEFVWDGDHTYPDDYPAVGADITVVGTFDSYSEGDNDYIQLINANLSF
ncbi:MAG: hypothetical protein J6Z00_04125 [Clostridia bacterium]|nr:hypothetical protein [Clostridia bacterium]